MCIQEALIQILRESSRGRYMIGFYFCWSRGDWWWKLIGLIDIDESLMPLCPNVCLHAYRMREFERLKNSNITKGFQRCNAHSTADDPAKVGRRSASL